ncbi:MAG: FAD-dependent oxidoreductase, partial [Planctomycetota bacterium]
MSNSDLSEMPPAVPVGRENEAFPKLSQAQVQRIRGYGTTEYLKAGTETFTRGQVSADFFVIVSGCIEIFDFDCDGQPRVFTVHGTNQFTGEIDLFSNRKVLVGGRTGKDSEVIRLNRAEFREMLASESDLGEIITRAFILRRLGILDQNLGGALLIGRRDDPETLQLRQFLQRNGYPVQVAVDGEDDLATDVLKKHGKLDAKLPLLLCHGEDLLQQPSLLEVAKTVGIVEWPDSNQCYDLAIIGGGPGGMAAAVYAASEGLSTVVLERNAPGGQAGTSSKIENYLGFPNGLSGQELAGRAQLQAQKFGATLALPMSVYCIEGDASPYKICVEEHEKINARNIIIASGATYRTLTVDNYRRFEGRGIHYAATAIEAGLCDNDPVIVVGGGNSAGQAAVYLSRRAKHVYMLVRSDSLAASMSDYLIRRIDASNDITLLCNT